MERRSSSRRSSQLPKRTSASGFDPKSKGHVSNIGEKKSIAKKEERCG